MYLRLSTAHMLLLILSLSPRSCMFMFIVLQLVCSCIPRVLFLVTHVGFNHVPFFQCQCIRSCSHTQGFHGQLNGDTTTSSGSTRAIYSKVYYSDIPAPMMSRAGHSLISSAIIEHLARDTKHLNHPNHEIRYDSGVSQHGSPRPDRYCGKSWPRSGYSRRTSQREYQRRCR